MRRYDVAQPRGPHGLLVACDGSTTVSTPPGSMPSDSRPELSFVDGYFAGEPESPEMHEVLPTPIAPAWPPFSASPPRVVGGGSSSLWCLLVVITLPMPPDMPLASGECISKALPSSYPSPLPPPESPSIGLESVSLPWPEETMITPEHVHTIPRRKSPTCNSQLWYCGTPRGHQGTPKGHQGRPLPNTRIDSVNGQPCSREKGGAAGEVEGVAGEETHLEQGVVECELLIED